MKHTVAFSRVTCLGLVVALTSLIGCEKAEQPTSPKQVALSAASTITTFRHPGVLNTQASLDLVNGQVNAGNASRLAAYNKVIDYIADKNNPTPKSFPSVVYVVAAAGSPTEDQIRRDAILAYAYALRWAKTNNSTYADQAKSILNGYAKTFERYQPADNNTKINQAYLEAAWVAPTFAAAAEIIRHYRVNGTSGANWAAEDITKFSSFLTNLKVNYIDKIPASVKVPNNWSVSYAYATMALGVFLDDKAVYDAGYEYTLQIMPQLFYADDAVKELTDRDCHHPQYTLTGLTYAAEIARNQGNNTTIYEYNGRQIMKGWYKMEDAIAGSYNSRDCSKSTVYAGVETAYNYYKTPKLETLRARYAPYGITVDKTFLGFTTFTHQNIGK